MHKQLRSTGRLWLLFAAFLLAQGAWAQQIIVNEFYRGGNLTTTDEFIEVLLTQDLTAAQLEGFYIGDATAAVTTKFSAYKLTGMAAIAPTFRAGTLIVLAGATAASQDLSYNPAGGDWTIVVTSGGANAVNANTGNNGDLAGTDVVWVDTAPTGGSVTSNGFAIKWTASTGTFAANVGIPAPANNSGVSLTSNLAGATTASNWVGQARTLGLPNGSANTTYIDGLRALGSAPTVSVSATDAAAAEVAQDPGTFRISRTGATTDALTVNYTVGGTASSADYTPALPGTVLIPTGQSFADISITPVNDADAEGSETVVLTLTASANYTVGATPENAATVTIADDDAPVVPNLSINDVTLSEGNAGTTTFTFTVSLSAPAPAGGVTFDIATADNTATTAGSDYVARSLTGQAIPAGSSTYTFDVTVNGDLAAETNETFFVNVTNVTGANATDGQGLGTITNDDATPATLISTIQGTGTAATPGTFTIEAIVVGVFTGNQQLGGFYVQEEDTDSDGNVLTSEGIFVNSTSTVSTGDRVRITGVVQENSSTPSFSQAIITPTSVQILGSGLQALVTPATVSLPTAALGDLERYEGMLVNFTQTLTVTETFGLGRFGEVVLANGRLLTPTNFIDPNDNPATGTSSSGNSNVAAVTAQQNLNDRSRIILDDGSSASNLADVPYIDGTNPTLRIGSTLNTLTGVLSFGFSEYRIQPTVTPSFTYAPRPAVPTVGGNTKVASFNVLNYFNGDGAGGGFPTSRGADTPAEFARQRSKIITAINQLNADVIGLIEIENDGDGTNSAIADLVNGLNATAPGTYSFVPLANTTGSPGTDEIKVAFVYKSAVVTPVGNAVYFNDPAFTQARPPLAQTFRNNANGGIFTPIINHFKSKGSTAGLPGDADQGDGQGESNASRKAQSTALLSFVSQMQTSSGDPDVMILGDLNSYNEEDPIDILRAGGFTRLSTETESYVFSGQTGSLDQALVSSGLLGQVSGQAYWNINSDEPTALDYNDDQITASEGAAEDRNDTSLFDGNSPFRSSDHDPVLVGLSLTPAVVAATPLSLTFTASPTMFLTTGSTMLSAMVSGGTTPYSYTFSGPGTITPSGNTASVSGIPAGVQTFTVTVTDATAPTNQTITGTVSVTVSEPAPTNQAPITTGIANQMATVGQMFSLDVVPSFSDPNGDALTFSASGLPMGLMLNGSVISGTPTMAEVSSVTVTATDSGNLSASTSFTITVNPAMVVVPPTGPFSITGVTTVSCTTVSAGLRQLTFSPQYAGTNGQPISFSVMNELLPTTAPGPYTLNLYTDNPTITLKATQSGTTGEASFVYNWLAVCTNGGTPPPATGPFSITGVTTVSCTTVSTGLRQVSFTPQYAGQTGQTISFSVVNELLPTTAPGPYTLNLYTDNPTITLKATQSGTAGEASFAYNWLAACTTGGSTPPPPSTTGPFSITGATMVNCATVSGGLRQVSFTPQYAGVSGQPVSFSVVNELLPTTAPGPYTLNLYTDNPIITLKATQLGTPTEASFTYNWLANCTGGSGRMGAQPSVESVLDVRVIGNPSQNGQISVEVRGVAGQPVQITLTDMRGQVLGTHQVNQADTVERHAFEVSRQSTGVLLLRATTPTQSKTVKVIKAN